MDGTLTDLRRALLGMLLAVLTLPGLAADGAEQLVEAYLDDFNKGLEASELASRYWQAPVMVFADGSMDFLHDDAAVIDWLAGIQAAIAEQGWRRSETTEAAFCRTGDDSAVYALRFLRHFDDGSSEAGAGTYLLLREQSWRIAGVILTDPDVAIRCDEASLAQH